MEDTSEVRCRRFGVDGRALWLSEGFDAPTAWTPPPPPTDKRLKRPLSVKNASTGIVLTADV